MASWVKNLYHGDDNGSSSDDESPEVVSTTEMKSLREEEINGVRDNKRKLQEIRKERKRLTMEKFMSEKKAKLKTPIIEPGQLAAELRQTDSSLINTDINAELPESKQQKQKYIKSYPTLNIKVQPLEKISYSRAKAAMNFKTKRLAKVNREDVSKGIISYKEKLRVKNT